MDLNNFLELPYGKRQLIAVVDDEAYSKYEEQATSKGGQLGNAVGYAVLATQLIGPLGILASGLGFAAYTLHEKYKEAATKGLDFNLIPMSLASCLDMPPGHPRTGILYVGHPITSKKYIQVADFHKYVFENKCCEIIKILRYLGAKSITVEHEEGWAQDITSKVSVGIPGYSDIDASGKAKSSTGKKLLYEAILEGHNEPRLPDDLTWFTYEQTWQEVADSRINFGEKKFSLKLQYKEDFGIDLGLKVKAEKAGLDLGGEFEKHLSTTWNISGTYRD